MERESASAVASSLEDAIAHLTRSLAPAKQGLSPTDFDRFQMAIGLAIGRLSHELLDPIYAQYPDLAPPGVL